MLTVTIFFKNSFFFSRFVENYYFWGFVLKGCIGKCSYWGDVLPSEELYPSD